MVNPNRNRNPANYMQTVILIRITGLPRFYAAPDTVPHHLWSSFVNTLVGSWCLLIFRLLLDSCLGLQSVHRMQKFRMGKMSSKEIAPILPNICQFFCNFLRWKFNILWSQICRMHNPLIDFLNAVGGLYHTSGSECSVNVCTHCRLVTSHILHEQWTYCKVVFACCIMKANLEAFSVSYLICHLLRSYGQFVLVVLCDLVGFRNKQGQTDHTLVTNMRISAAFVLKRLKSAFKSRNLELLLEKALKNAFLMRIYNS